MTMDTIKIEIPSITENIRIIESFIDNAKERFNLNDDIYGNIMIEDEGIGFDFQNLPDPTSPENLDKPSGRGIFLMKHLSDEVNFSNNGSLVELSFYMS